MLNEKQKFFQDPTLQTEIKLKTLIWSKIKKKFILGATFELLAIFAACGAPFCLKYFLDFLNRTSDETGWSLYLFAVVLSAVSILQNSMRTLREYYMNLAAIETKKLLILHVYSKIFRLSLDSRNKYSTGNINNFMPQEIEGICSLVHQVLSIFSVPLRISIAIAILFYFLGYPALISLVVIFLSCAVTCYFYRKSQNIDEEERNLKTQKFKQTEEILFGIKVIKLYAWEKAFFNRLNEIRSKELEILKDYLHISIVLNIIWYLFPMLLALVTFTLFIFWGSDDTLFNVNNAYVSLAIFKILGRSTYSIPRIILKTISGKNCLAIIQNYLNCEETQSYIKRIGDTNSNEVIRFVNASFSWESNKPNLENINLSIKKGELIALIGPVGSGKTSLISAIVGELLNISGSLEVADNIKFAYVPQLEWIQSCSVRDNIVFRKKFDENTYKKVIKLCELHYDLSKLPMNDLTEVGDCGVTLSGGQRQRIGIARALYQDADVYIFDNPLSAVDPHVGKKIFDNVIGPDGVLRKKTRILVTQNLHVLEKMSRIIIFDNGKVVDQGTYSQLKNKHNLTAFTVKLALSEEQKRSSMEIKLRSKISSQEDPLEDRFDYKKSAKSSKSLSVTLDSLIRTKSAKIIADEEDQEEEEEEEKEKTKEKPLKINKILWKNYFDYIDKIGILTFLLAAIFFLLTNVSKLGSSFWIKEWAKDESDKRLGLLIYYIISVITALFFYFGFRFFFNGSTSAAQKVYLQLVEKIFHLPLRFFDITPMGKVVNRLSKDITSIDKNLPQQFMTCLVEVFYVPLVFLLICFIFFRIYLVIFLFFIIFFYYEIYQIFLVRFQVLRRFESASRPPLLCTFSETVSGQTLLRVYKTEEHFKTLLKKQLNKHLNFSLRRIISVRWLEVAIQVTTFSLLLVSCLLIIQTRKTMTEGIEGLILSYLISICGSIIALIMNSIILTNEMISLDRIEEYISTPSEAPYQVEETEKKPWKIKGTISFENYSTSYEPTINKKPILNNLNLIIQPGEKVGIVGRTGAGKSTMVQALFRLIEPLGGAIKIDDLDISKIGLHTLRSKLTIIPQDSVVFTGTLKFNLDPFDEFSDKEIYDSLTKTNLDKLLTDSPDKLNFVILEGGDNLSIGEKQLICLARAILRKPKILVLDEATASLDPQTQSLIDKLIFESDFDKCTVITIAHRIGTVLKYDKIIVMDEGRIKEIGKAEDLIKNKSTFYKLAEDAGVFQLSTKLTSILSSGLSSKSLSGLSSELASKSSTI